MNTRYYSVLFLLALPILLAACGGGGGGGGTTAPPPPPPPPAPPMSASGLWVGSAVTPDVPDIVSSFEFDDSNGFTLGNEPFTAVFGGGVTESRGVGALYSDGLFSWHIDTANGSIDFPVPGDSLSFQTRTVSAGDTATIEILDEFGAQLSMTAVPDVFTQINVQRMPGQSRIASVIIEVTSGEIVIDSFSFGFPSTAASDDIACLFAPDPRDDFVCILTDTNTGELVASANGTFAVNGDQVSGSGNVYAAPGGELPDGSTIASLDLSSGTVAEVSSLDVIVTSTGLDIDVTAVFDDTYDRGADLATVAAMYTSFDVFGDMSSFDIDAGGVITGQTASGCVLDGLVSVIDAAANAYDVNLVADAGTCGALAGDYDGLGTTQDEAAMNDAFVFAVFVDGMSTIIGEAVK
ncbi:MAG: hypothetical protein R3192_17890 [Woeseiaceae bacterium]|nr:hypothetical protein [Woeseiaceae bacterium]